jgi:uncharacterized protein (DUF2252 family)
MKIYYKSIITGLIASLLLSSCGETLPVNFSEQNIISASSRNMDRDIVSVIRSANQEYAERNPEIIKLKYKSMAESAFAFFRCTGYLFYSDITKIPALATRIKIPVYGDMHLENVGTYHTATQKVAYDLNDFDDAASGPYTWDLARCAVSIFLAAAENGMDNDARKDLVDSFINSYIDALKYLQKNNSDLTKPVSANYLSKHAAHLVENVAAYSHSKFIDDLTANGHFKFNDKFIPVSKDIEVAVTKAINNYSTAKNRNSGFKIKSIAGYISGKASLGRYRYAVLLEGATTRNDDDFILELKEAAQPTIASATGNLSGNQAQRVVQAEKYFLISPDPYLGTTKIGNIDFFVREVQPDDKVNLAKLNKKDEFKEHLKTVALIIARAHARSGSISQILQESDNLAGRINSFADDYAKQVNDDYSVFKKSFY